MKKVHTNKGFTLAELLIVVAVIAVLVAIAIPTFGSQAESAREGVDAANIRSKYAEVVSYILANNPDSIVVGDGYTVTLTQKTTNWQNADVLAGLEKLVVAGDYGKGVMAVACTTWAAATEGGTVAFTYAKAVAASSTPATLTITVTAPASP